MVQTLLVQISKAYKYIILTALSLEEAEADLEQHEKTDFQLVISDLHLTRHYPVRDGYALYQRLTDGYPGWLFLLINSHRDLSDLTGVRAGAASYLQNPSCLKVLLETVRKLIGHTALLRPEQRVATT